jgi:hypothetical protein
LLHVILKPTFKLDADGNMIDDSINPLDFSKPVLERGFFRFYSRLRKKQLYLRGRKEYNYDCVKGNFVGTFPKFYTVNEQAYKDKKAKISLQGDEEARWQIDERKLMLTMFDRGIPYQMLLPATSTTRATMYDWYKGYLLGDLPEQKAGNIRIPPEAAELRQLRDKVQQKKIAETKASDYVISVEARADAGSKARQLSDTLNSNTTTANITPQKLQKAGFMLGTEALNEVKYNILDSETQQDSN